MSFGLVPVVSYFFSDVSLVSPVVNLVAIPVFSFLLVPLALVVASLGMVQPVAGPLIGVASIPADWVWRALATIADLPFAAMTPPAAPAWAYLLGAVGVAMAAAS